MNQYETTISQVPSEIDRLVDLLVRENVKSFLEVGSRFGGSLWRIANALPIGSRIVSCDSGKGMGGKKPGAKDSLRNCIAKLKAIGYDAHLLVGHSQSDPIIASVSKLGPFDACFIDGDHTYRGVLRDWMNYGRMSKIVAFHDVGWVKPDGYENHKLVEVPRLWGEVKGHYRSEEFIDRENGGNMGIGVLWRG